MKIKVKDMQRIIKEEVEKQREKIAQIAVDSCDCPDVDPKKEIEGLPDEREGEVEEALKAIDEELVMQVVKEVLIEEAK